MKKIEKLLALGMLLFAIGFNLWLYRAEPTAMVDPNDNAFQYGLVDRTNQIWDWGEKHCHQTSVVSFQTIQPFRLITESSCLIAYLIDHWVPNWAEGYNLPYYYSHIPQIVIVGTYRILSPVISLVNPTYSLFTYYHWIIYLLLCFFPLSVFLALRILKLPWLTTGIAALFATHISTDGLYGMDPPSFLWRGWGLSSQLFAMIFMPLALAYSIRVMSYDVRVMNNAKFKLNSYLLTHTSILAILFIALTTMGHLGLGLMLFLSLPVIAMTRPIMSFLSHEPVKNVVQESKEAIVKTILIALPPILLLSYWILPTLIHGVYHNISFWDPVWKFNSYGAKEVLVNLWNGSLFDWGRLPVFTLLVGIGFFVCLLNKWWVTRIGGPPSNDRNPAHCHDDHNKTCSGCLCGHETCKNMSTECGVRTSDGGICAAGPTLSFLFLFFLLLYFGKTTWGGILDIIPSMSEFHQHRFIVGLHLVGLFLAPIGVMWLVEQINKIVRVTSYAVPAGRQELRVKNYLRNFHTSYLLPLTSFLSLTLILLVILPPIYKQTFSYGNYNEILIDQANTTYSTQKNDAELLVTTLKGFLKEHPGRVFAGRGGSWGKNFTVAESAYFMYLSTYGVPTVLWLPETWSNNSDTEQYFSEDVPDNYNLYNIRYVVTPNTLPEGQKPQPFWKLLKESNSWKVYEVEKASGYITTGVTPAVVYSDKVSFGNLMRLWIQSPYPEKGIYPQLVISSKPSVIRQSEKMSESCNLKAEGCLPHFVMVDEATYMTPARNASSIADAGGPDGNLHSLFAEPPAYMTPWEWPEAFNTMTNKELQKTNAVSSQSASLNPQLIKYPITVVSQSSDTDMIFRATVEVKETCPTCVVILKQTYHPNWSVTVNGKPYTPIDVFPSYTAIRLEEPGTYKVVFTYTPSKLKMLLLAGGIITLFAGIFAILRFRPKY